jgi:2-keto-3-deoxy-6-phosphogluconate aldolase
MKKQELRDLIEGVGLAPVIRTSSAEDARFAAEEVAHGGIPIVEVTMTVPGAIGVIRELARTVPGVTLGAGTVLDLETARECIDAGAQFISAPALDLPTVEYVAKQPELLMIAGALTPTEVLSAWKAGSDFVKIFPCSMVGEHRQGIDPTGIDVAAQAGPDSRVDEAVCNDCEDDESANGGNASACGAVAVGRSGVAPREESSQCRS